MKYVEYCASFQTIHSEGIQVNPWTPVLEKKPTQQDTLQNFIEMWKIIS